MNGFQPTNKDELSPEQLSPEQLCFLRDLKGQGLEVNDSNIFKIRFFCFDFRRERNDSVTIA